MTPTSDPPPKIGRTRKFPLVWTVPLIALAVGGWMAFHELIKRGPDIVIEFANGSGVAADKTVLEHKGVSVGLVTAVELKQGLDGVIVHVRLDRSAAALARKGAQFWVVHPEISLSGIRGLDTLITGARLNVRPGKGPASKYFVGLEKTPAPETPEQGKTFTLHSDRLGSLTTGAAISYREMKVGVVETSRITNDATGILVRIHIDAPYTDLIRTNTRFWNSGGFSFKFSLLGAELKNTSLESLVAGGIAFATPDGGKEGLAPPAPEGMVFTIASEPEKEWLKWAPKIPIKAPEVVSELKQPINSGK